VAKVLALQVGRPFRLPVPEYPTSPVSTPRSSSRTCGFAASGSRTKTHALRSRRLEACRRSRSRPQASRCRY